MNVAFEPSRASGHDSHVADKRMMWTGWAMLAIGLIALYGPAYAHFTTTLWVRPDQQHAPLIALSSLALAWRYRPMSPATSATTTWLRTTVFMVGLAMVLLGKQTGNAFLILLSQVPVLAGLVLWTGGAGAWQRLRFPVLFLLFMVPLPGILTEAISLWLKSGVSVATETLLHSLGYPAARQGVIIGISQYQVLVADACSGLQSMTALSALGTVFIHLRNPSRRWHRTALILSLLPVALLANLIRVVALALLTYHAGSEAGQWLHALTGVLVFSMALAALATLDHALSRYRPTGGKTP